MKKNILLILVCIPLLCFSQSGNHDSRLQEAVSTIVNKSQKGIAVNYAEIKGEPYFNTKFSKANIQYLDLNIVGEMFLRYNAYTDEIEIGKNTEQKVSDEVLLKNSKMISTFNNEIYLFREFKNEVNKVEKGYLIKLHKGEKYTIYQRIQKVYRHQKKATTSLQRNFPSRFSNKTSFYIQQNKGSIKFLGKGFDEIILSLDTVDQEKALRIKKNYKKIKDKGKLISLFYALEN